MTELEFSPYQNLARAVIHSGLQALKDTGIEKERAHWFLFGAGSSLPTWAAAAHMDIGKVRREAASRIR